MADCYPKTPSDNIIALDYHRGIFFMLPFPEPGWAFHAGYAQEGWSKHLGTDGWNEDVKVQGHALASVSNQLSHCVVPHLNLFPFFPPMFNFYIPILIWSSSSKNFLAVGSVLCRKGPVSVDIPGAKWLGVNLGCNERAPLPTNVVIGRSSTVILGFTAGDLVAALAKWAVGAIQQEVGRRIGKFLGGGKDGSEEGGPLGFVKKGLSAAVDKLGGSSLVYNAEKKGFDDLGSLLVNKALGAAKSQLTSKALSAIKGELLGKGNPNASPYERIGGLIDGRSEDLSMDS